MIMNWIARILGLRESSGSVGGVEPLLRSSAIDEPGPLASVVDSPDLLHKELERARRYERGLSRASRKASGPPQVVTLLAAAGLRDLLRQSDVLCYQPTENRFVLAFAESDAEEAEEALARLSGIFRERLELDIRAGTSRFPDDALTLAGLIDSAAGDGSDASERVHASATSSSGRVRIGVNNGAGMGAGNGDGSRAGNGRRIPIGHPEAERGERTAVGIGDGWHGGNGQRRPRRMTPPEVNDDA
jgi:hypothetical protein